LSHLPEDLADAACRLATGGGFGGRELYSDHNEATFDATRPLVFNAIPDLGAARPDFLDRALIIEFLEMKPEARRDEAQFWCDFEQVRPRILGALLDAASAGLRNLPNTRRDQLPRMADFALWVNACEGSLGMSPGEAMTNYSANRAETRNLVLESSPVYEPVAKLAREGFTGTVAELLARLNGMMSESVRRSVRWPKAPNALSAVLRRMAGNLRAAGIEIQFSRADLHGRRLVSLVHTSAVGKRSSVIVSDRQ
jgi:putative DNA primase/helicase